MEDIELFKMTEYKSCRIGPNGKPKWYIVDENGNLVNRRYNSADLKNLKILEKERRKYSDTRLINYLKEFHKKNGRSPVEIDFDKSIYPDSITYIRRFGSWKKALELAGLDFRMVGVLQNANHKGRLFEIFIKNHFSKKIIDLSGDNHNSPWDGICPNGMIYDAKSSGLVRDTFWLFHTKNKYKEEIKYYYFGAFNKDYTKLIHVWRIPWYLIEKDYFIIGTNDNYEYNIENMNEYEITDIINIS